jgi:hypothetical protein
MFVSQDDMAFFRAMLWITVLISAVSVTWKKWYRCGEWRTGGWGLKNRTGMRRVYKTDSEWTFPRLATTGDAITPSIPKRGRG